MMKNNTKKSLIIIIESFKRHNDLLNKIQKELKRIIKEPTKVNCQNNIK